MTIKQLPTEYEYPTAEQLRRLYFIIQCEDDYGARHAPIRFGRAVLALWGASGYLQTHQPTDAQLSVLALLSDD
jgi:hypothetical protein